ncbi:site-specific integrase [Cronobacter sakazakii]|uniref:Site-specific integrase n=1 Tax=Mixta calida TaxID=665913 RepID=A0ABN5HCB0_9GAMM|nr:MULTISPECIES: site-specific integrase [Enterobacterales]AUY26284.1 site-specific integrase [Mixta calida]EGT4441767.1 site-specific integrase [Cronobacter sakazakii]ELY5781018.1 site-specific integrase [Cronobacter sakazakii]ORM56195.1 integrase [Mixta calida]UNM57390.1 site-specific integrase [Cronobacter sakazakii]
MTVRKLPNGKWICECYPGGREGKRIRKQFATKGEAIAFESFTMEETDSKPWLGEKADRRKLSELIQQWYSLYGQTLADPKRMLAKLHIICRGLSDPVAADLTAGMFTSYREARLKGEVLDENGLPMSPVKPRTVNLEQRNLSSVFGTLKRLGHWQAPNPLSGLPTFKIAEGELSFLAPVEIKRVLDACAESSNKDLLSVAKICLATGARWSEAENLQGHQITKYRITYTKTKGKKNRTVPISNSLYEELPKSRGKLFKPCRKAFERAINRAGIELPEGQCTHVLRHTFASHFMMNGGNILVLRDILGHADIKMTMVYAHFAPDHLEDAVTKNPLHNLNWSKT